MGNKKYLFPHLKIYFYYISEIFLFLNSLYLWHSEENMNKLSTIIKNKNKEHFADHLIDKFKP